MPFNRGVRGFDVGMAYTYVLQVPVEFGLEFVTVIGANSIDPEWELGDDVIHEVDRILLRMPLINLQGANAGRIIDCRVLEIPDLAAFLSLEIEEFHIDLYVVPRHLLLIANSRESTFCAADQAGDSGHGASIRCIPRRKRS